MSWCVPWKILSIDCKEKPFDSDVIAMLNSAQAVWVLAPKLIFSSLNTYFSYTSQNEIWMYGTTTTIKVTVV